MNKLLNKIVESKVKSKISQLNESNIDGIFADVFRTLNENYVFDDYDEESEGEEIDQDVEMDEFNDDVPLDKGQGGIDPKIEKMIGEIRRMILLIMAEDSVTKNPEMYKSIKSIWDSCDKLLITKK